MRHYLVTFKYEADYFSDLRGLNYYEVNGIIKRFIVEVPSVKRDKVEILEDSPNVSSIHLFDDSGIRKERRKKRKS